MTNETKGRPVAGRPPKPLPPAPPRQPLQTPVQATGEVLLPDGLFVPPAGFHIIDGEKVVSLPNSAGVFRDRIGQYLIAHGRMLFDAIRCYCTAEGASKALRERLVRERLQLFERLEQIDEVLTLLGFPNPEDREPQEEGSPDGE